MKVSLIQNQARNLTLKTLPMLGAELRSTLSQMPAELVLLGPYSAFGLLDSIGLNRESSALTKYLLSDIHKEILSAFEDVSADVLLPLIHKNSSLHALDFLHYKPKLGDLEAELELFTVNFEESDLDEMSIHVLHGEHRLAILPFIDESSVLVGYDEEIDADLFWRINVQGLGLDSQLIHFERPMDTTSGADFFYRIDRPLAQVSNFGLLGEAYLTGPSYVADADGDIVYRAQSDSFARINFTLKSYTDLEEGAACFNLAQLNVEDDTEASSDFTAARLQALSSATKLYLKQRPQLKHALCVMDGSYSSYLSAMLLRQELAAQDMTLLLCADEKNNQLTRSYAKLAGIDNLILPEAIPGFTSNIFAGKEQLKKGLIEAYISQLVDDSYQSLLVVKPRYREQLLDQSLELGLNQNVFAPCKYLSQQDVAELLSHREQAYPFFGELKAEPELKCDFETELSQEAYDFDIAYLAQKDVWSAVQTAASLSKASFVDGIALDSHSAAFSAFSGNKTPEVLARYAILSVFLERLIEEYRELCEVVDAAIEAAERIDLSYLLIYELERHHQLEEYDLDEVKKVAKEQGDPEAFELILKASDRLFEYPLKSVHELYGRAVLPELGFGGLCDRRSASEALDAYFEGLSRYTDIYDLEQSYAADVDEDDDDEDLPDFAQFKKDFLADVDDEAFQGIMRSMAEDFSQMEGHEDMSFEEHLEQTLSQIRDVLTGAGIAPEDMEVRMIPLNLGDSDEEIHEAIQKALDIDGQEEEFGLIDGQIEPGNSDLGEYFSEN